MAILLDQVDVKLTTPIILLSARGQRAPAELDRVVPA